MKPTLFARYVVTFSAAIACASPYAAIPKEQDVSGLAAEVVATKPAAIQWPNGAKAAVSLSYDDALNSQLDNAVPELAKHGFRATFYLTLSAPAFIQRQAEWQQLAAAGHELGNHTIHHACHRAKPGRQWVAKDKDLATWPVAKISAEIQAANAQLQQLDGKTLRTFTPPCSETQANDGDYLQVVAPLFAGIKVEGPLLRSQSQLGQQQLPTWFVRAPTLAQLIDYTEQAAQHGTIASITFHGVGGDHLAVERQVHQQYLAYLAQNRDKFWVDSYINIRQHLQKEVAQRLLLPNPKGQGESTQAQAVSTQP